MREFLDKAKTAYKGFRASLAESLVEKYLEVGSVLEDIFKEELEEMEEQDKEEPEELDLDPLYKFMDEYVGMMVLTVRGFSEDVTMEDTDLVTCKIISECRLVDDSIEWHLNHISGKSAGYLKISPSKHGSFAEREANDIPIWSSRYRIFFYGGDTLEYFDTKKMGHIEFFGE